MEDIFKHISDSLHVEAIAFRSQHAVTIVSQYPYRHVQIVLRLYKVPLTSLPHFYLMTYQFIYSHQRRY